MSNLQNLRKTKVVGSGHGMFKFVRKHSQPIGDHPLTDTLFLHIAWKYKPSQPIEDHPLWPCPLLVVSNFVCHSYKTRKPRPNTPPKKNIKPGEKNTLKKNTYKVVPPQL